MYWYNRLSSKFDGRNILVDVLQEWCGTTAERTQKRKTFADVSQNRKESLAWAQKSEESFSKSEEKGCEVEWARTGADNQGKN